MCAALVLFTTRAMASLDALLSTSATLTTAAAIRAQIARKTALESPVETARAVCLLSLGITVVCVFCSSSLLVKLQMSPLEVKTVVCSCCRNLSSLLKVAVCCSGLRFCLAANKSMITFAGYGGTGSTGCTLPNLCASNNGGCPALEHCWQSGLTVTCGATCPPGLCLRLFHSCVFWLLMHSRAGYDNTGVGQCTPHDYCANKNGGCDPLTTCTDTNVSSCRNVVRFRLALLWYFRTV